MWWQEKDFWAMAVIFAAIFSFFGGLLGIAALVLIQALT